MNHQISTLAVILFALLSNLSAEVSLSGLFTDHAVLQRNVPVKIWGWADPSEKVQIEFLGEVKKVVTDAKGNWSTSFSAQKAGGPHLLRVKGNNTIERKDLLFGEVWLCSGQSNMVVKVINSRDGDIESLIANDDQLRLITISNKGSQELHKNIVGKWELASGDAVSNFSAVGYYYGRELRRALKVPVGLIDTSYGSSACEAWVPRDTLKTDSRNNPYLDLFAKEVANYDPVKNKAVYKKQLKIWEDKVKQARANHEVPPRKPGKPSDPRFSQKRPSNLYNTRIHPMLGYGIKGAIWYQGENNTRYDRSYNYRYLLPMMIKSWRKNWGIGEFSFYWSQLADFDKSRDVDGISPWAEIRESMTMSMQTTQKTGQAVIIDLGEDIDIHPKKKYEVAKRLVRWALVNDYGFKLECSSPVYKSHEVVDDKIIVSLDHLAGGIRTYDVKEVLGFTIAGEDQKFIPAQAKILMGDKIQVWNDKIKDPVAVRYAWAGNPECNLYSKIHLPLTPFRTDSWKLGSQIE